MATASERVGSEPMRLQLLILVILFVATPRIGSGQALASPEFARGRLWTLPGTPAEEVRSLSTGIFGDGSNDHRYTGAWIGVGLAAAHGTIATLWCKNSENPCSTGKVVAATIIVGTGYGILGAMVGTLFPKQPPPG